MRVIAGIFRSRTLYAPAGDATRPTSDRARESLFSVLGLVRGLRVLDLYAGTGALAIEAISRGAGSAVCVECNRSAVASIERNIGELALADRVRVVNARVDRCLKMIERACPFELVFADPPWDAWRDQGAQKALKWLSREGVLSPHARIVAEHPSNMQIALDDLSIIDQRSWGDTGVTIFEPAERTDR
jgi:16S rRNA (guanine(966)-N(2))-methyltransferase RsmD